jgi:hypothetical protein
MNLITQPVPDGTQLFDAFSPPGLSTLQALKAEGFDGAILYPDTATQRHVDWVMQAGMGLMFVGECRHNAGWLPSSLSGSADGLRLASLIRELDRPTAGVICACDVEGCLGTPQSCIDYINAWTEPIVTAGLEACLYVGAGITLSSEQLYDALLLSAYWHSGSSVPDVAVRGYRLRQIPPLDRTVCGHRIDVDESQADKLGGQATWMIDADMQEAA